jgi:sulfur relay (sulfurtransferase) complex TusBCD TusD component (DsrE family)
MKTLGFSRFVGLAAALSVAVLPTVVSGDLRTNLGGLSNTDNQDVVVSLKVNPLTNPEQACLAVTLARALKRGTTNVTLFATLDGVALGDAKIVGNPKFRCTVTPAGDELSLEENLSAFLADNPRNMVICPICWVERYGSAIPDYGAYTSPVPMLLRADKILDY